MIADGLTHASRVIAVVRSKDGASFTLTSASVPLKYKAPPNFPAVVRVAFTSEPVFPFPDESVTVGPVVSLNAYAATRSAQMVLPPSQTPAWQVSPVVQGMPSLHVVPSAFAGFEQMPVPRSQTPVKWHESRAVHTTGVLGPQAPVPVLQTPGTWHKSGAEQTTGELPVHTPAWQVSVWVQALASLHGEPLDFAGLEQAPDAVSHTPATWH